MARVFRAVASVARHRVMAGAYVRALPEVTIAGTARGEYSGVARANNFAYNEATSSFGQTNRGFASGDDTSASSSKPGWRPGPGPEGFDPDDLLAPLRAKVEKQMTDLTEKTPSQVALENQLGPDDGKHDANANTGEWNGPRGPEPTRNPHEATQLQLGPRGHVSRLVSMFDDVGDALTSAPADSAGESVVVQTTTDSASPAITGLKSFDAILAEKRARSSAEPTGSGKTIVVPPDEVKARLMERQRKQRERAEAAREVAAKVAAEREKAEMEGAIIAKLIEAKTSEPNEQRKKVSPDATAETAIADAARKVARQKELAARTAAEKKSPQTSALDANAKFLAAAAARALAAKESGTDGASVSPAFATSATHGRVSSGKKALAVPKITSFEEVMAAKKAKEAKITDEERNAASKADEKLTHKTITVTTENDETVEISMKVHVPQERLAMLAARKAKKDDEARDREDREVRAKAGRLLMRKEHGEGETHAARESPSAVADEKARKTGSEKGVREHKEPRITEEAKEEAKDGVDLQVHVPAPENTEAPENPEAPAAEKQPVPNRKREHPGDASPEEPAKRSKLAIKPGSMTVAVLRKELEKREMDTSGLKAVLVERLQTVLDAETGGDETATRK